MKPTQNTPIEEVNIVKKPVTRSMIDRYLYAASFCFDKDVISVSSGFGYGEQILVSLGANSVTCIDNDMKSIEYINSRENSKLVGIHTDLFNFKPEKRYDVVVSIETMEHLPKKKVDDYLSLLKVACKKDGKIIITSPNRITERFIYRGGTHLYEYSFRECMDLFQYHFGNLKIDYFPLVEFSSNIAEGYFTGTIKKGVPIENTRINFFVINMGDKNE